MKFAFETKRLMEQMARNKELEVDIMANYVEMAKEFSDKVSEIRKGLQINIDEKIAEELGMTVEEMRRRKKMAREMLNADGIIRVNELKRAGYSVTEIAKLLGEYEGFVRWSLGKDEDVAQAIIEIYAKKLGYTE